MAYHTTCEISIIVPFDKFKESIAKNIKTIELTHYETDSNHHKFEVVTSYLEDLILLGISIGQHYQTYKQMEARLFEKPLHFIDRYKNE
jgi:hypothetical protein